MTHLLGETLKWGREALRAAGLDDYNISAELLLQSVLNLNRSQLLLSSESEITLEDFAKYKDLINKRARRTPLQYLIGWVEFHNIRLQVDNRALIPRPETEILVETVIQKLREKSSLSILDIGTGSGNIAIALAKDLPGAMVTGIDISIEALELARANARNNSVESNTFWKVGDIRDSDWARSLGRYDCVVSNPPYVTMAEKGRLEPEVIEHEPSVALFSGEDPLNFFRTITEISSYIITPGGLLAFEVGMGQAGDVAELMRREFEMIEIIRDLAGIERVITGAYGGTG